MAGRSTGDRGMAGRSTGITFPCALLGVRKGHLRGCAREK